MKVRLVPTALACALVLPALAAAPVVPRTLTFEDRVAAQRAIEEVYWRHRIWPSTNRAPKPALSTTLSEAAIRGKVEDYAKKSNAIEKWWDRRISAPDLQAELDRMSRQTRDPRVLRELFAALGNDPLLIAETLARQSLVDRLIRNWFAYDTRIHGDVRRKAERALAGTISAADMREMGGAYSEERIHRRDGDAEVRGEWEDSVDDVAESLGTTPAAISAGRLSGLEEERDQFSVAGVISVDADELVVGRVVWPKRSFESWWETARVPIQIEVRSQSYESNQVPSIQGGCIDDTWRMTLSVPTARTRSASVWTGAEMIVWGGAGPIATGGRYDPATDTWTPTAMDASTPSARFDHSAVWTGVEMLVWGGQDSNGPLNTGARYRPSSDSWAPISTAEGVPTPRERHTAVWTGNEMIVWGADALGSGGRYDPSTDTWQPTSLGENVPSPRILHTAVWTGSEMIVWGGFNSAFGEINSGARYNPLTDSWTPTSLGTHVPERRRAHSAIWTGTEMIVWGGAFTTDEGFPYHNSGGRYDPATDSWTETSTGENVPFLRRSHSAVWTGTEMIIWGGSFGGSERQTGGRYNPSTDTWNPTSTGANVPDRRVDHEAVWTGTEMIVWGGSGDSPRMSSGGLYDPSTDSWVPTSMGGSVPSARQGHTSVWTGSELIVWGGATFGDPLGTGGLYTPTTDTWSATPVGDAPTGRIGHTAVWTGTEMIVWGGGDNTGGRYAPSTDTWNPTSTDVGVPSGRSAHTAVWTGSEMIVWGGGSATGGRYDPTSDTWVETSTTGKVPIARSNHTAVWTGTDMIVWGGRDENILGTGSRYNPLSDDWTAIADGPAARAGHSAIWNGMEMVIWGGDGGASLEASGGRYHAASNTWLPTPIAPSTPSARSSHSAVWTGEQMIVWGGSETNTGGRYGPTDDWTPTSTSGHVPSPRLGHIAGWTGREMLIWGGDLRDTSLYRYCVCTHMVTGYEDTDEDGRGNPTSSTTSCDGSLPEGYVANADDCDDGNPSVYAGAPQSCDGLNNDCLSPSWPIAPDDEADLDTDGFRICQGDCNDSTSQVHPGALESCDAVDNNCNGQIDEDSLGLDTDGDGIHNACDNCRLAFNPDQLDADGDLVGSSCDNCVTAANAAQEDLDSDQRGDACDNCPAAYNPFQDDSDVDSRGDACDNCLFDFNPMQSNFDHDGQGDRCDLNDGLIYVYSTDPNYIEWQVETGPGSWNVYEGNLGVLRSSGVYAQAPGSNPLAHRTCGVGQDYVEDFETPTNGVVKFSLVTGVTGGVEGSLGSNSAGTPRVNTNPCP